MTIIQQDPWQGTQPDQIAILQAQIKALAELVGMLRKEVAALTTQLSAAREDDQAEELAQ